MVAVVSMPATNKSRTTPINWSRSKEDRLIQSDEKFPFSSKKSSSFKIPFESKLLVSQSSAFSIHTYSVEIRLSLSSTAGWEYYSILLN